MNKLVAAFMGLISVVSAFAEPVVTDVVAKQRYPWNGLVDITCKVTGISGTDQWKFSVAAVMPDTGNAKKVSSFWIMQNGTNPTDRKVHANGNYHLLWDAKADLGQVNYDNMVVRVTTIDHDKIQLWEGGPYWADTNIGAEEPEDYGYYFCWGDTVGYKYVNNAWVAASDGSSSPRNPTGQKSIATLKSEGWITADSVLVPAHDAAHVHWGGNWRMPTRQELIDLSSKCDWTRTTMNGVNGHVVRGRGYYASVSIFLPDAGYFSGGSLVRDGTDGVYWSSMTSWDKCSWSFDLSRSPCTYSQYRYFGQPVRPVQGFTE